MTGAARLGGACVLLVLAASAVRAEPSGALVDTVPSITVEGEAKRDVTPDLAVVTLGVTTDRATAVEASEDNAKTAATLVATARKAGLKDADIQTSEIGLGALTDQRDPSKINAFRASNQITLRVHALDSLGPVVGQLAAQGANTIAGIAFAVEDPGPTLDVLRAEATQDARRQADIYAKAAGVKLGRVLRMTPDVGGRPYAMARTAKVQMVAPDAAPPVEVGAETLAARVQITWELVP